METYYYTMSISNRKDFTNIKKKCCIKTILFDGENKNISVSYKIKYFDENDVDITNKFAVNEGFLFSDNKLTVFIDQQYARKYEQLYKNSNGDIVTAEDPDAIPQYTEIGFYDYLIIIQDAGAKQKDILAVYIYRNDITLDKFKDN